MTLRSTLMLGLVTMLVLFAIAPSSSAQVSIQLITDPSAGEIQTTRNAQTASPGVVGDGILVSGQLLANSPLTATILRLTFPGPITSSGAACENSSGSSVFACPTISPGSVVTANIPSQDPIRIEGATGVFSGVTQAILNTTQSRIDIPLPGSALNSSNGSFRVVGVRIDANGKTGAQSVTAALDSSANNFVLTTTSATIISSIANGLGSVAIGSRSGQPNLGAATIFTNRTTPDSAGSFVVGEGFASAFRTSLQSSNSATAVTNGTRIRLTFNGVPAGVTINLTGNTDVANGLTVTLSNPTITSTASTSIIDFTGTSLSRTEQVEVDYTITNTAGALSSSAAVTTPGTITVTSTLFPIGDGLVNDDPTKLGLPRGDQGYPTFAQLDVGPVTVVNIVAANTTLLMPYALVLAPFDTGVAIANTTADPFGGAAGGGAVAAAGTVQLNFFPTAAAGGAGTAFSMTTSATVKPGSGLSSDGTLAAGATWTVLLSQLLTAAGQTGNFVGYIFVQANFLDAHGTATISDFRTYSLTSNVLVLAPPAASPRTANNAESLGN